MDDLGKELGKNRLPAVHVGDTVEVHYLIKEGDKERIQLFVGTVLSIQGRGISKAILVRRIVQGEGVERMFPLHSPRVKDVKITRRGDVRRAKLYYLRERVGKKTRVGELLGDKVRRDKELEEAARRAEADAAAAPADGGQGAEGSDGASETDEQPETVEV